MDQPVFFSKAIARSSDQVASTQSFHSLQDFKLVLLTEAREDLLCLVTADHTADVNSQDAVAEHLAVTTTVPLTTN